MSEARTVFRKELRELAFSRSSVASGALFAVVFGALYSLKLTGDVVVRLDVSLGSLLFFLTTILGVFMGYTFTTQVFLREKMDGVVETLLCSPASLRGVWFGKTLGVTVFAHALAAGSGVLTALVTSARLGTIAVPNAAVLVYLACVVPLVIACLVGALGFAQLLLGMRENRIVGLALFIPLFAGLYGLGYSSTGTFVVSWLHVGLVAAGAVVILAAIGWGSRFLSRERIVTTLP
jgi:ABC-2 type transport system permease protein